LIGSTPEERANDLLAESLETFVDAYSGTLEGLLGAIYYPTGQKRHLYEAAI
jgi:hypothetical protein